MGYALRIPSIQNSAPYTQKPTIGRNLKTKKQFAMMSKRRIRPTPSMWRLKEKTRTHMPNYHIIVTITNIVTKPSCVVYSGAKMRRKHTPERNQPPTKEQN